MHLGFGTSLECYPMVSDAPCGGHPKEGTRMTRGVPSLVISDSWNVPCTISCISVMFATLLLLE